MPGCKKNQFWTDCSKYDIPEVQLIVEILRLIEELCDVWLKFLVQ